MTDSDPAGDLSRTLRTMATVGGQIVERAARLRAEQHRVEAQQSASARVDGERHIAQQRRELVDAGRLVYGPQLRDHNWDQPDTERRVGEALFISEQLSGIDPAARMANDYLRREAAARYGGDAEQWLHTAYQRFAEAVRETHDRQDAAREDHQTTQHVDRPSHDRDGRDDRADRGPGVEDVLDEQERANQQHADAEVLALGGIPGDVEDPASGWSGEAGHFPVMDEPSWREPDPDHDQAADQDGDRGPDLPRMEEGHGEGHEQQHGQAAASAEHRGDDALDHAAAAQDRHDRALHGGPIEGIAEVAGVQPAQEFRIGQRVRRDGFPTDAGADQGRGAGHTRPAGRSRDADRQRGRDRGR